MNKLVLRGLLGVLWALAPALGAQGSELAVNAFERTAAADSRELPPQANPSSALEGVLAPNFFSAKSLNFSFGQRLVVLHRTGPFSDTQWSGKSGRGDSEGTFTYYKGVTVGTLRDGSDVWELRPSRRAGIMLMYQVDTAQLPPEAPPRRPPGF